MEYAAQDCLRMIPRRILLTLFVHLLAWASEARAGEVVVPEEMRLGALPRQVPEPGDNPGTPAKVALGRLLFFDPILSATQNVACATCHHPRFGWADGRATPLGIDGVGLGPTRVLNGIASAQSLRRNVPTLLNVGFNGLISDHPLDPKNAPLFWDARVQGLEAQVLHPIRTQAEMRGAASAESAALGTAVARVGNIAEYRVLFAAAFSQREENAVNADHLAKAIAAFERTLVAADSPFDRFLRGDQNPLIPEQERGMRIFQTAGCILCHGGPMFSDFKLHFIGVSDAGPDGRREIRTPTLRNLRHTAPYMHHGGQRTLDEVLTFYERLSDAVSETLEGGDAAAQPPLDPLLKQLDLNAEDFTDLTAFLETLNDDHYDQTAPAKVPSGLPVGGHILPP